MALQQKDRGPQTASGQTRNRRHLKWGCSVLALSLIAIPQHAYAGPTDPTAEVLEGRTATGETTRRECLSNGFIQVLFITGEGTSSETIVSRVESSTTCTPGGTPTPSPTPISGPTPTPAPGPTPSATLVQNYSALGDRATAAFISTTSNGGGQIGGLFNFLDQTGSSTSTPTPNALVTAKRPCTDPEIERLTEQLKELQIELEIAVNEPGKGLFGVKTGQQGANENDLETRIFITKKELDTARKYCTKSSSESDADEKQETVDVISSSVDRDVPDGGIVSVSPTPGGATTSDFSDPLPSEPIFEADNRRIEDAPADAQQTDTEKKPCDTLRAQRLRKFLKHLEGRIEQIKNSDFPDARKANELARIGGFIGKTQVNLKREEQRCAQKPQDPSDQPAIGNRLLKEKLEEQYQECDDIIVLEAQLETTEETLRDINNLRRARNRVKEVANDRNASDNDTEIAARQLEIAERKLGYGLSPSLDSEFNTLGTGDQALASDGISSAGNIDDLDAYEADAIVELSEVKQELAAAEKRCKELEKQIEALDAANGSDVGSNGDEGAHLERETLRPIPNFVPVQLASLVPIGIRFESAAEPRVSGINVRTYRGANGRAGEEQAAVDGLQWRFIPLSLPQGPGSEDRVRFTLAPQADGAGGTMRASSRNGSTPWQLYLHTRLDGLDDGRTGADIDVNMFTASLGGAVKLGKKTALGGEIFYRSGDADSVALNSEIKGDYYGGSLSVAHQIADKVKFGASVGYTKGKNDLNVNGGSLFIGSFDAKAFSASAVLQAEVPLGGVTLEPYAAASYNSIKREGFTDITGLVVPGNDFSSGKVTAGANITQKFLNVEGFNLIKPRFGIFADYQDRDQAGSLLANGQAFRDLGLGVRVSGAVDFALPGGVGFSIGGDYSHYHKNVKRFAVFAKININFR